MEEIRKVKAKLTELVDDVLRYLPWGEITTHTAEDVAEHMMQNGVTIPEWISVKDGLPENDYGKYWEERQQYLVLLQDGTMRVARYGYKEHDWWIVSQDVILHEKHCTSVTHWMPMPQPPKGE